MFLLAYLGHLHAPIWALAMVVVPNGHGLHLTHIWQEQPAIVSWSNKIRAGMLGCLVGRSSLQLLFGANQVQAGMLVLLQLLGSHLLHCESEAGSMQASRGMCPLVLSMMLTTKGSQGV
eukprot:311333-Pelagomonas_calceolata.AAC.2